jgi:signal transduction histidine kinase
VQKIIMLLIFWGCFSPLKAQISNRLYQDLTDSIRPKNANNVSLLEAGSILRDYYSILDPALRLELSVLAEKLGSRYHCIEDVNERAKFTNDLSWFWYQRNMVDSVDKYSKITLDEALKSPRINREKEAYALKMQGYLKLDKDNFSGAFADFQEAIKIFSLSSEFEQISDCRSGILMIFQKLQLYDRVISDADSTISFINKYAKPYYQHHLTPYVMLVKARAYISKFKNNNADLVSADSAKVILTKITQFKDKGQKRWRIEGYTELSRLLYHQNNFSKSIVWADSAFLLEGPDVAKNTNRATRIVYKGLSFIQKGLTNNGIVLLKSVDHNQDAEYNNALFEQLFSYESKRGNYKEALVHHQKLLEYAQRSQILRHTGRVFELEAKNNILEKDLVISQLQKNEESLFRIGLTIACIIGILGIFFGNRYLHARKQSKLLVRKIDDLTDIQMVRIEDAEIKIRQKISQDLHDDFSSSIAASTQFIKLRALTSTDPDEKQKLHSIANMLKESYIRSRTMSHQIYFNETEEIFWERLYDHISLFFAGSNIEHDVDIEADGLILPVEIKITIFQIVKESIVNIIKHSSATSMKISVFVIKNWLHLEISDNGKGMHQQKKRGIGLNSIYSRVHSVKGNISIENQSKGGAKILVRLPTVNL